MHTKILSTLFLIFLSTFAKVHAQPSVGTANTEHFNELQDSLISISNSVQWAKEDMERIAHNTTFVKKLVSALKTPHSFLFDFKKLTNISILKAPNQSFRIITWSLPFNDGTYKFYGTIQMATTDGSLKLIPLNDDTNGFTDDNLITNHKKWYGARYYELIPITHPGKTPYYILLGWKGNTAKTTKKVVEVLSIDKNEAIFGKNIFETPKSTNIRNRIVFEYNKNNSMTLTLDRRINMIVFDHLAPYDPEMTGNFEYYGSDLSFDGYVIDYHRFRLKENILLKNAPSANDELYNEPTKASSLFQKNRY